MLAEKAECIIFPLFPHLFYVKDDYLTVMAAWYDFWSQHNLAAYIIT